jgi:hypothetical protein
VKISVSTSKINFSLFKKKISKETQLALKKAGLKAIQIIQDRTAKGQGVKGAFKAYSASYANDRRENGYPVKPDLFRTGAMLGSMQARQKSNYVEIYFNAREQNKKAFYNDKIRPFFDLTRKEQLEIQKLFRFIK